MLYKKELADIPVGKMPTVKTERRLAATHEGGLTNGDKPVPEVPQLKRAYRICARMLVCPVSVLWDKHTV